MPAAAHLSSGPCLQVSAALRELSHEGQLVSQLHQLLLHAHPSHRVASHWLVAQRGQRGLRASHTQRCTRRASLLAARPEALQRFASRPNGAGVRQGLRQFCFAERCAPLAASLGDGGGVAVEA